ncbi:MULTISPECIES: ABC transporter substrate-binding protein [unclassified Haladaptatus]|uniref:ABC transporter substrate-binding protein n=1 Tax=unclassified Haladaptatus TaxID=2622732 RepID=UPI00209C6C8C|nr:MULTISPECIES: ABC transporter substrate-binding protein [unclassified Haladaptatus]MCO8245809.1 ABC transporter substrate-binding protein [Haladaptatus sp. AB643]MCO8256156.1 ABC transporter substrate-binding protein [Haladaptatus sp. AB618]
MRDGSDGSTRREYVKYGGVVIGGGLLAGCTSDSTPEDGKTKTTSESTDGSDAETVKTTDSDGSYTVTMEPVGAVEFESVPVRWSNPGGPAYLDMGIALGQLDGLVATGFGLFPAVAFEATGISIDVDPDEIPVIWQDGGFDKEVFYEADSDVHFADPNYLQAYGMSKKDIEEVSKNVGPFFGAYGARPYDWNSDYMPSLYDLFDKVAEVFREQGRGEQFRQLHAGMLDDIEGRLPAESDRPTVGVLFVGSNPSKGSFQLIQLREEGFRQMHYRDADFEDAWASMDVQAGEYPTVGYETLLDVDPDVLIYDAQIPSAMDSTELRGTDEWRRTYVEPMRDHAVGRKLTAVKDDAVYPGGPPQAGPLLNLFNTERTVKQVYPDEFGADEKLFDRQRVRDIVNGAF